LILQEKDLNKQIFRCLNNPKQSPSGKKHKLHWYKLQEESGEQASAFTYTVYNDSGTNAALVSGLTSSFSHNVGQAITGISKESCCSELRNLSESYYGKIDPIDGPSGENIGIAQSIVVETIIENGVLQNVKNS
jgi:hypothetical protein